MRPCLLPHKGVVSAGMQEQVSYVVPFAPEKPERVIQRLAPRITVDPDLFHDRIGGTKIIPHDQIVFIVEKPIKRRGGKRTVIRDFFDRVFFDTLFCASSCKDSARISFVVFRFICLPLISSRNPAVYWYAEHSRFLINPSQPSRTSCQAASKSPVYQGSATS